MSLHVVVRSQLPPTTDGRQAGLSSEFQSAGGEPGTNSTTSGMIMNGTSQDYWDCMALMALTGLEARRHRVSEDAARGRGVTGKLQEERAIIKVARDEGRQLGWCEGLRKGMLLGRQGAEEKQLRFPHREEDLRLLSRQAPMQSEESSPEHASPSPRTR